MLLRCFQNNRENNRETGMAIVLFDCDGVLVNTEEIGARNARSALQAAGLHYSDEQFEDRVVGCDLMTLRQNVRDDYFAATGQQLGEDFFDDMHARYLQEEAKGIAAIAGVRDFVESLARSQIPFAICSNSFVPNIERKIRAVGLYDLFAGRILGRDNVAHGKPAPDVYLAGMTLLGETDAQKCVVIEDSAVGVRAGHAAGMRVMAYTGGSAAPAAHGQKLQGAGAVFAAATMAAIALETFEQIDMINQGPNWRNAPKRAQRIGGPAPV